jgi:hypothetical protein
MLPYRKEVSSVADVVAFAVVVRLGIVPLVTLDFAK